MSGQCLRPARGHDRARIAQFEGQAPTRRGVERRCLDVAQPDRRHAAQGERLSESAFEAGRAEIACGLECSLEVAELELGERLLGADVLRSVGVGLGGGGIRGRGSTLSQGIERVGLEAEGLRMVGSMVEERSRGGGARRRTHPAGRRGGRRRATSRPPPPGDAPRANDGRSARARQRIS